MFWFASASAGLHVVLLAGLLVTWRPATGPQPVPPLEIEMIQSPAMTPGDAPAQPKPPPPQPPAPQSAGLAVPKPPLPPPPVPQSAGLAVPKPPPPPPPAVHIGNASEQSDPLTVTGDNIVPPAPDARFRNQPPHYPAEAARIGAEGTVQLVIRVSAQGIPVDVRVVQSSGYDSLDSAAMQAARRWRFRPALSGGLGVAFDYPINIHFAIGDHP